ncbi:MAG: hypothetical protein SGILL_010338, partial [Bacillariaceae sp.]
ASANFQLYFSQGAIIDTISKDTSFTYFTYLPPFLFAYATMSTSEDKILSVMMQKLTQGTKTVSFEKISKTVGFHIRSKGYVAAWKKLINEMKYVEPASAGTSLTKGDHQLTEAGIDYASTDEYKEMVKDLNFVATTNEDHQERLKNRMLNDYARGIFELLLNHGALDRKEMAGMMKTKDGSHGFSYGLKKLKDDGIVMVASGGGQKFTRKKLQLSDKAFLEPSDRPSTVPVDPEVLKEAVAHVKDIKKRSGDSGKKDTEGENEASPETNESRKKAKVETEDGCEEA